MEIKLNRNRQKIFQFIKSYNEPVNPQIIVNQFKNQMDQATVYRNLSYLEKNKIIEGFLYNCQDTGTVKFYIEKTQKHYHFLHCKECHHFQAIEECNKERINNLELKNDIKIENHIMYYTGICSNCLK